MFTDEDYPADPYPGRRPDTSFVHLDGVGYRLVAAPPPRPGCLTLHAPSGFVVARKALDLDRWLAQYGAAPLAGRTPVLAYGSNACPSKITWLRTALGLRGPVVLLRAEVLGYAAVWADGFRARDGQRPVTLMPMPGVTETHAVWLATDDQVRVLDRCEGIGDPEPRYRAETMPAGAVVVEGFGELEAVRVYVGACRDRMPQPVGGGPVRAASRPPT